MTRQFDIRPAQREKVPLLIGLAGASGSGKTYSALELATGIQSVAGGDIHYIDTEARRALHYADRFKFHHLDLQSPFGSLDYLAALQHCAGKGAGVVVVDSASHEHEGVGGMLDAHEKELDRLAGTDFQKRERCKMLAWVKPKADRRALINGILQLRVNLIFCFRAKNMSKPVKVSGKTEVVAQGFMPISGDELVYEMTACMYLPPHSQGVPVWDSEYAGEKMSMKLPCQFANIFSKGRQLDRKLGTQLAEWARGGITRIDTPDTTLDEIGALKASEGTEALKSWWAGLSKNEKKSVEKNKEMWKSVAAKAGEKSLEREPGVEPDEPAPAPFDPLVAGL